MVITWLYFGVLFELAATGSEKGTNSKSGGSCLDNVETVPFDVSAWSPAPTIATQRYTPHPAAEMTSPNPIPATQLTPESCHPAEAVCAEAASPLPSAAEVASPWPTAPEASPIPATQPRPASWVVETPPPSVRHPMMSPVSIASSEPMPSQKDVPAEIPMSEVPCTPQANKTKMTQASPGTAEILQREAGILLF